MIFSLIRTQLNKKFQNLLDIEVNELEAERDKYKEALEKMVQNNNNSCVPGSFCTCESEKWNIQDCYVEIAKSVLPKPTDTKNLV